MGITWTKGENPKCSECGFAFSYLHDNGKFHQKFHNQWITKGDSGMSSLSEHFLVNYECLYCNKEYPKLSQISIHLKQLHNTLLTKGGLS